MFYYIMSCFSLNDNILETFLNFYNLVFYDENLRTSINNLDFSYLKKMNLKIHNISRILCPIFIVFLNKLHCYYQQYCREKS